MHSKANLLVMRYAAVIHNDVQRTSIFLGDRDREAIRVIQERYGVSTDSDAIRLALRVLAEAKEVSVSPLPPQSADAQTEREGDESVRAKPPDSGQDGSA